MGRVKGPPVRSLSPPPPPIITRVRVPPNFQSTSEKSQASIQKLSNNQKSTQTATSSEVQSSMSTSFEKESSVSLGVSECPHCQLDLSGMAVTVLRDHVESCSRPTTAGSDSAISEPPESPRESADLLDGEFDSDSSDLEDLSDLEFLEDGENYNFDGLPTAYEDEEDEDDSGNEDSTSGVKFRKLRDSNEILASLDGIEHMSNHEAYRRAANVASILDTIQKEWMELERKTAKAAPGDGVPTIRNPRLPREKMAYQDRLEADVYGYTHNPHPTLLGRQDPIGQRQGASGDDQIRSRLRKPTKKAAGSGMDYSLDLGESSRPTRARNTPNRYESQSREQTPAAAVKKPRGRKGGRIGELKSGIDSRTQGARTGSPLAYGNMSENGLQSLSSLRDKTLASTEVDEDSGMNSRPSTRNSSKSDIVKDSATGKKRAHASDGNSPNKKARAKSTTGDGDTSTSNGKKKTRAKQMVLGEDGQLKSKQSLMMAARWKSYKENPDGPRIGRVGRPSQSEMGSDARSSRKRSLGETNDSTDAGGGGKRRKISSQDHDEDQKPSEQAPAKAKRGGARANSGRKPAKSSAYKAKRQSRSSDGLAEDHREERWTETPAPPGEGELMEPSSGSTRASTRPRKPTMAKQEADDKTPRGQWGGKRAKGKHNDGSRISKAKESLMPGVPVHLQEGMVLDTDSVTDDDDDDNDDDENDQGHFGIQEETYGNEDDGIGEDDEVSGPSKKIVKPRKAKGSNKPVQPVLDDFADLPVYDKDNPSAEYKALPKNLKMKAVSRARWANGKMHHMFGQKGPNKSITQNMVTSQPGSSAGGVNSNRTSVSATHSVPPSSVRRRPRTGGMGMDDADERESSSPPLKRKISEYEEFQALASKPLDPDAEGKRRRRPAAMRASTSFIEPSTSSDFEEEEAGNGAGYGNPSKEKKDHKEKDRSKSRPSSSKRGIGRLPRLPQIQTDVANAAVAMSRSGVDSGSGLTIYEEFLALSAPGSPMVLPKRKTKLRGGEVVEVDDNDEYNDEQ